MKNEENNLTITRKLILSLEFEGSKNYNQFTKTIHFGDEENPVSFTIKLTNYAKDNYWFIECDEGLGIQRQEFSTLDTLVYWINYFSYQFGKIAAKQELKKWIG